MKTLTQAQMNKEIAKRRADIKAKAEALKQQRELAYYTSDRAIIDSVRSEAIIVLNKVLEDVAVAYPAQHEVNSKLNDKLIPTYGYTTVIDKVATLASGIKYLSKDFKDTILNEYKLDELLIDDTVAAMGKPSYYSKRDHAIVEEVPYDSDAMEACLARLSIALGVDLTTERVATTVLQTMYKRARNSALEMYNNTEALMQETLALEIAEDYAE